LRPLSCGGRGRGQSARRRAALPHAWRNYPVSDLEEALAEGILSGHPAMPEFAFEPDEIDAIIAYLESLQPK